MTDDIPTDLVAPVMCLKCDTWLYPDPVECCLAATGRAAITCTSCGARFGIKDLQPLKFCSRAAWDAWDDTGGEPPPDVYHVLAAIGLARSTPRNGS